MMASTAACVEERHTNAGKGVRALASWHKAWEQTQSRNPGQMDEISLQRHLVQLAVVLKEIKENPVAIDDVEKENPGLTSSFQALYAVIKTLDNIQPFRGEGSGSGLTKDLWNLALALKDLVNGEAPPMLKVHSSRKRGSSTHYQAVNAWSSIYLDCLMKAGEDESSAAKKVASYLKNVRQSTKATKRTFIEDTTVKTWRHDLNRNMGKPEAQICWDKYRRERPANANPQIWVVWAEKHLLGLLGTISQISP